MSHAESEWTFVSKGSKKSNRRNKKQNSGELGHHGLYQQSNSTSANNNNQRVRNQRGINESKRKDEITQSILECMESLENQYQSKEGFAHRLFEALSDATAQASVMHENGGIGDRYLNLREIVVYGIGNFSCEPYSGPMLQLAAALLLRRLAASKAPQSDVILFSRDQQQTPMFYYEPCILPLEKELLEDLFYVHILEGNELGKLTVEEMQQQLCLNEPPESQSAQMSNNAHTLFYMPHCPMRLYCNVLWAHWDHVTYLPASMQNKRMAATTSTRNGSANKNPIIIFGNSFHAYDDRTISSEQRLDRTNGMFRLVQYATERSVYSIAENRDVADSLRMLERAFNDCNIISFSTNGDTFPERPKEYFASEDPNENGELL